MLQDLDINDDDGGLPTTHNNTAENEQSQQNSQDEHGETTRKNRRSSQSKYLPKGNKPIVDGEKVVMSSRYNHRIYRAYIRGKVEQAKRLIAVSFNQHIL